MLERFPRDVRIVPRTDLNKKRKKIDNDR